MFSRSDNWDAFWAAYAAFVSDRLPVKPEDGAAEHWDRFIRTIPDTKITDLVQSVANHARNSSSGRKPNLTDFKAMWSQMRPAHDDQPTEHCTHCHGDGLLRFLACYVEEMDAEGTSKGRRLVIGEPQHGRLYECATPCICQRGWHWRRQLAGLTSAGTKAFSDRVIAWRDDLAAEARVRGYRSREGYVDTRRLWNELKAESKRGKAPSHV